MGKYKQFEESEPAKGPHRDYPANLVYAERFCDKAEKSLPEGMMVKVRDSEGLKKSLLMISWHPPIKAQSGNYANPIFLHQSKSEVVKQTEETFNFYLKRAKEYWGDRQQTFLEPTRVSKMA